MKRLLFLLLIMSLPIQTKTLLESTDERISYTCVVCREPLSRSEASLGLLMAIHEESPIFICDQCKKQRGKKDGQLKEEAIGYKPAVGIVSARELDTGQRSVFRQSPSVQEILFKQYQQRRSIAVATPQGYRVLAKKRWKYPFFFLKVPGEIGYRTCKFPTVSYIDEETGKEVVVALPVDEMTPLVNGNILVTAFGQVEGGGLLYRYDPRVNKFHRLRAGELVKEMESCDELIAQAEAKKAKNKKVLGEFFNALFVEAKKKKAAEAQSSVQDTGTEV